MLKSSLFSGNKRLADCAVSNPAHVTQGQSGDHVALIQCALVLTDDADIAEGELDAHLYGKSTAKAVLDYKTKRAIINKSYQSKPDDIVGIMTIQTMDAEVLALELLNQRPTFGRPGAGRMKHWS